MHRRTNAQVVLPFWICWWWLLCRHLPRETLLMLCNEDEHVQRLKMIQEISRYTLPCWKIKIKSDCPDSMIMGIYDSRLYNTHFAWFPLATKIHVAFAARNVQHVLYCVAKGQIQHMFTTRTKCFVIKSVILFVNNNFTLHVLWNRSSVYVPQDSLHNTLRFDLGIHLCAFLWGLPKLL